MNDVLYFQKQEAVRAFPQVVLRLVVVVVVEVEVVPASFMLNLDIYYRNVEFKAGMLPRNAEAARGAWGQKTVRGWPASI